MATLDQLISPEVLLLDTRTQEEYDKCHLPEAVLVPTPMPPLSEKDVDNLRNNLWTTILTYSQDIQSKYLWNQPIAVYCKVGKRSSVASKLLNDMIFTNVFNLGGIETKALADYIKKKDFC